MISNRRSALVLTLTVLFVGGIYSRQIFAIGADHKGGYVESEWGDEGKELKETARQHEQACQSSQLIGERDVKALKNSKRYGDTFRKYVAEQEATGKCPPEGQLVAEFFAKQFGIERFTKLDNSEGAKDLRAAEAKGNRKSYSMQTVVDQALKDELIYVIGDTSIKTLQADLKELPGVRTALKAAEAELGSDQDANPKFEPRSENLKKADLMVERAQNSLNGLVNLMLQREVVVTNARLKKTKHKNIPLEWSQQTESYRAQMRDFNMGIQAALGSSPFLAMQGSGVRNEIAAEMEKQMRSAFRTQIKGTAVGGRSSPVTQEELNKVAASILKTWVDPDSGQFNRKKILGLLTKGVDLAEKNNKKEVGRLDKVLQKVKNGVVSEEKQALYDEVAGANPNLINDILTGASRKDISDYQSLLRAYCLFEVAAPLKAADEAITTLAVGSAMAAFGPLSSVLMAGAGSLGVAEGMAAARLVRLGGIMMGAHGAYHSGKVYTSAHDGCKKMAEAFDQRMVHEGINEKSDPEVLTGYAQQHLQAYSECESMANSQQALAIVSGAAAMTGGVSALRASNQVLGASAVSRLAHGMFVGSSTLETTAALKHMYEVCGTDAWDTPACNEAKLALASATANAAQVFAGNRGPTVKEAYNTLKYAVKSPKILAHANSTGLIHETINFLGNEKSAAPVVEPEVLSGYLSKRRAALAEYTDTTLKNKVNEKKFLEDYDAKNEAKELGKDFESARARLKANKKLKAATVEESAVAMAISRAEAGNLNPKQALDFANSISKTLMEMRRRGELSVETATKKGLKETAPKDTESLAALTKQSEPLLNHALKSLDPRVWSIVTENFKGELPEAIQIYYLLKTKKHLSGEAIYKEFVKFEPCNEAKGAMNSSGGDSQYARQSFGRTCGGV